MDKIALELQTAKDGFKNEFFVIEVFNNWKKEILAQESGLKQWDIK